MSRLVAEHLGVALNGVQILTDVSLALPAGEIVGLVGPNGAGKSTLIRAMGRLVAPQQGRVLLDGVDVAAIAQRDFARRVAYLPQGHALHWRLDVAHLVALGRSPHQGPFGGQNSQDARAIAEALRRTQMAPFAERDVASLSGGERARAMLARVVAVEAEVVLADEPTASLDPGQALHVMELLRELVREGRSVLVVLHDLSLALRFCDRLVLIHQGAVLAQGAPRDVLASIPLASSYQIEAISGAHEGEGYLVPWRRLRRDPPG